MSAAKETPAATPETPEVQIPPGYIEDSRERLVPIKHVKKIDLDRDKLVRRMAGDAEHLHELLVHFREQGLADIDAFVARSVAEYGVSDATGTGNVTLSSYDGRVRLQVLWSETMEFDERLQAARSLIESCVRRWSRNAKSEVKTLLDSAFATDKKGRLDPKRILALRKLDIKDGEWEEAMRAIADSVTIARSHRYLRIQRRGANGKYETLSLSVASA